MGWIIIHDKNNVLGKEIRKGLQNLTQRIIGSNTLVQGALPAILKNTPKSFFDSTIDALQKNAELAFTLLSDVNGLKPYMPQGAMYMMIGIDMLNFPEFACSLEFAEAMVMEESAFCLPGECFNYPGYMRIVLTVPEELIREACFRIKHFCKNHFIEKFEVCHIYDKKSTQVLDYLFVSNEIPLPVIP
uniref:Aminotransferase class I/classII large domain-containing protein n=2 Tax=Clastoptera arizonana TaxID=38151 RepID=A0A1B6DJB1_9HEMI